MNDIELYETAVAFLLQHANILQEELNEYLEPVDIRPNDINVIYKRLCYSAQNRQMSKNVIGGAIGGIENLRPVLFDFNPQLVANKYGKNNAAQLLSDITNILQPPKVFRNTPRSLWPQYCKSIIDAAHFLKSFSSGEEFYRWIDLFEKDARIKPALPMMISLEVDGIGVPLACDFLKELGISGFGKPDVHLKEIFEVFQLLDPNASSLLKKDYETLKVINRIAEANGVSAFAVDKVFWLIGSGDFYLSNQRIAGMKDQFIGLYQNRFV